MSIFNWINKWLGTDSHTKIDLPPEFELSNNNVNDSVFNTTGTNILLPDFSDPFEEAMTNFIFSNMEELFKHVDIIDLDFLSSNRDNETILNGDIINQSITGEVSNKIPKKNYKAQDYFLKSGSTPRNTLSESPVRNKYSSEYNRQSQVNSYYFGQWNGRKIEKQVTSKQLPDGITQQVIVLKDGDKKSITTLDFLYGNQLNCKKELYNLDESELDDFEKRFSKFK